MRVLLAIEGSPHSDAAVAEVSRRSWPDGTVVEILTVIHWPTPVVLDQAFVVPRRRARGRHGFAASPFMLK